MQGKTEEDLILQDVMDKFMWEEINFFNYFFSDFLTKFKLSQNE